MFRIVAIFILFSFSLNVSGQESRSTKVPLSFYHYADQMEDGEMLHLYVKGNASLIKSAVDQANGVVKRTTAGFIAISIPKESFENFANLPEVDALHLELGRGMPLLNESRVHTRIDRVHNGTAGLVSELSGEGVIIGVIDAGLDLSHPDFLNADSSTRVLELWDQTMGYSATRTPSYGYGQVYDSADINANNCPHLDQPVYYGHGTNTTGIAAGNGLFHEQYTGCAPEADLIVVSSNFNSFSWTATVADAVDFILARADAYGKPCVINASLGTYIGSHDGMDAAARDIASSITTASGRVMVCAGGNSGEEDPYHLGYEVDSDTSFTWFKTSSTATVGNGVVFYEIFGNVGDMEDVKFSIGADQVSPYYAFSGQTSFDSLENRLYVNVTDSLFGISGNYLARVETWADSLNGTYRLQVYINNIDSIDYNFRLSTTGSGRIDLWSTSSNIMNLFDMVHDDLPSNSEFPPISNYKLPDYKQQIVSSWACADEVITVGNYTNRNEYVDVDENVVEFSTLTPGAIAASSSAGPNRMGSVKPDVVAPGELTLTAGAAYQIQAQLANVNQRERVGVGGMHNRAGGTSSASPVVTGIAALFFELCPNANWADFKTAITNGAIEDGFTGTAPNDQWGYGKADAVNALRHHLPEAEVNALKTEFCEGESITMSLDGSFASSVWNTGATGSSIVVNQSGQYFALLANELGCSNHSDTLNVFERPNPVTPIVQVDAAMPACSNEAVKLSIEQAFGSYLWNSNEATQSILVQDSGMYWCEVKNQFGCRNTSDSVLVWFQPMVDAPVLHHQVGDILKLQSTLIDSISYRWYMAGNQIANATDSLFLVTSPGYYFGSVIDSNGCEWKSKGVDIGSLSIGDNPSSLDLEVFPNPAEKVVFASSNTLVDLVTIFDARGARIFDFKPSSNSFQIDISNLQHGLYLMVFEMENAMVQKRVLKL